MESPSVSAYIIVYVFFRERLLQDRGSAGTVFV